LGQVSRIHVEVDFSGEPLFADFAEEGGDETEQGRFVWKEGGDAGSASEFLIDALDGVACAHAALVGMEGHKACLQLAGACVLIHTQQIPRRISNIVNGLKYRAPHSALSPEEIILDIKERISRGELQVGAKLPTTRELCQIYKIAPNTLSRCIRKLKENGYISTKVGDGIYITDPEGSTTARLQREHFKTTSFVFRIHSTGDANSDHYLSHIYDQAILGIQDQSIETGVASGAVICPDSLVKDKAALVEFVVRHSATADGVYFIGQVESISDLLAKAVRKPSIFVLSGQHSLHQQNVFTVDRYLAACTIMRYLFDKGHRRIACLGGPLLGKATYDNTYGGRARAWSDIMSEYGQPLAPSLLFSCTEHVDDITRAAEAIVGLSAEKRPGAVFCFNDMRAMILLRVAERAGLRIPENMAIVGFDGARDAVEAGITTIEPPFYLNGRNAATSMRLLLKGEISPPIFSSISGGVKVGKTA